MPKLSNRGVKMPQSPIRKLAKYATEAKQSGKYIYHLNIGQPDIPTPKVMLEAIQSFNQDVIAYTPSQGTLACRTSFAEYYQQHGICVDSENILITNGASEALSMVLSSCLDEEDEIIIPEPFYANYNAFAVAGSAKVVPVSSSIEENFSLPSIADFEQLITPQTKAILLCNPNNPTGYVYSKEELVEVKQVALKHDLFLIVDEVYREFVYDGEHTSILAFNELEQHAIVVDSISKRYSACGARIGMIVTKNQDVLSTCLKFAQARLSVPLLEQHIATTCNVVPKSYMNDVKHEYLKRRNILIEELSSLKGVKYSIPNGAFYSIVELPVESADHFCQWLLTDFEYEGQTVMLSPANGFYVNRSLGQKQVRIAYVLNETDLRKAIRCLAEALAVYPNKC